jgi:ADP-ribose pyrophosphatase YjhB (NUDIX family)
MLLEDAAMRDALRKILDRAVNEGHLISEEVGIVNNLFEKFDKEIARKTKELTRLEGEIHQLKLTKRLVIDMIKDTIKASERAQAREETFQRMKEGKAAREAIFVEEEEKPEEEKKKPAKRKRAKKEKK